MILSGSLFAEEVWSGWTKVTMLYPTENNSIFYVETGIPEYGTCSGTNYKRYSLKPGTKNHDTLYSTLVLAYTSGAKIKMNINVDQKGTCSPRVNRFQLRK